MQFDIWFHYRRRGIRQRQETRGRLSRQRGQNQGHHPILDRILDLEPFWSALINLFHSVFDIKKRKKRQVHLLPVSPGVWAGSVHSPLSKTHSHVSCTWSSQAVTQPSINIKQDLISVFGYSSLQPCSQHNHPRKYRASFRKYSVD